MTHDESGPCNTCEGTGTLEEINLVNDTVEFKPCFNCNGRGVRDYQVWAGE